jgi:hypothetical protein
MKIGVAALADLGEERAIKPALGDSGALVTERIPNLALLLPVAALVIVLLRCGDRRNEARS